MNVGEWMNGFDLPGDPAGLTGRGKWKDETQLVAALVRKRTGMPNRKMAGRLNELEKKVVSQRNHVERLIWQYAPHLELPTGTAQLARLRKGDGRKAMLAALLRRRTTVGFEWIATRLHMGHPGSVSRLVCNVKRDRKLEKRVNELENLS